MTFIDTVLDQCIEECKKRFEDNKYHEQWIDYISTLIMEKTYPYIMVISCLVVIMFILLIVNVIFLFLLFSKK